MGDVKNEIRGFANGVRQLLTIGMVCGTVIYGMILFSGQRGSQPVNPEPGPKPQPFASLEQRVKQAISHDPELALRYSALYEIATGVVLDESQSARAIQADIIKAKERLGLDAGEQFRSVVRSHFSRHGGDKPDRSAWAKATSDLSAACLEAAQ